MTYRETRRDQATASDYLSGYMACSLCNAQTDKADLGMFGARCRACYDDYCRQGRHYPGLTPIARRAMAEQVKRAIGGGLRLSGKDHVAQLQSRAESGERLSAGQRGFLAAVNRQIGGSAAPVAFPIVVDIAAAAMPQAAIPADDAPALATEDAGLSA